MEYTDIHSEEFKKWFGNSKIVDKSGKTLIVYHGTDNKFDKFNLNKVGTNTGNCGHYGYGHYGYEIYFSYDIKEAKYYGKYMIESYLHSSNPFTEKNIEEFSADYGYNKSNVYIDKNWLLQTLKDYNKIAYELEYNILQFGHEVGWKKTSKNYGNFYEKLPTPNFDWNYISDWIEHTDEDSESEVPEYIISDIENVLKSMPKFGLGYTTGNKPNLLYLTDYG